MSAVTRGPGELEREVLACLAASSRPLSVQDVRDEVAPELAYTTVMTELTRLHEKHAVVRERNGRAFVYSVRGDERAARAAMTAHRMHQLLRAAGNRRAVLRKFVDELASGDEQLLRTLLEAPNSVSG